MRSAGLWVEKLQGAEAYRGLVLNLANRAGERSAVTVQEAPHEVFGVAQGHGGRLPDSGPTDIRPDEVNDVERGGAGTEDRAESELLQRGHILLGNDATGEHKHVIHAALP